MSKVSITGDNSGTGTFTIAAPNSNNNRTFNLPDEAGTALTDASDLEPQVKTSLNATGDAPMFACRAFCNFNGTGTISIRESGNVSSITDRGTGDYTVNFAVSMPDTNYSVMLTSRASNTTIMTDIAHLQSGSAKSTSSVEVDQTRVDDTNVKRDSDEYHAAIFR